jgi:hypothetical protein
VAHTFSGPNLSGSLTSAYLSRTLGDVKWNENTKWENVRGLDTAVDVPSVKATARNGVETFFKALRIMFMNRQDVCSTKSEFKIPVNPSQVRR